MNFENIFELFIETNIKQEPMMLVLYTSSCNVWKGPNSTGFKWNQEMLLVTNTKCSDWKYKKTSQWEKENQVSKTSWHYLLAWRGHVPSSFLTSMMISCPLNRPASCTVLSSRDSCSYLRIYYVHQNNILPYDRAHVTIQFLSCIVY